MKFRSKIDIGIRILILFLLLSAGRVLGQKHGGELIDSLKQELAKAGDDTGKVNDLIAISANCYAVDPVEGIRYGNAALALAQKLNWQKGIAWAYNKLGINYWAKSAYDTALDFDFKSLKIMESTGDDAAIAKVLGNIGIVYGDANNYQKAIDYEQQALELYERLGDKKGIAKNLGNMGAVYNALGNYPKSLECYFNALKTDEQIGDKLGMAINSANIGSAYEQQDRYEPALNYEIQALKVFEELGDKEGIAVSKRNIGALYRLNKQYDQSLDYCNSALKVFADLGDKNNEALTNNEIGIAYSNTGKYDLAIQNINRAIQLAKSINDKHGCAKFYGNLGGVYLLIAEDSVHKIVADSLIAGTKTENLNRAISLLTQSALYCKESGYEEAYATYKNLSDAYRLNSNYKEALNWYVQYANLNDSLNSAKNKIAIANLETVRELDVKEQELKVDKLTKKTEHLYYLTGIALLLLIVGLIVRALIKQRIKVRSLSVERRKNLQKIEEQSAVLEDITFDQAHTIRAPLATVLGLAYLFNKEDPTDPVNKEVITHMTTAVERLDSIVKDVVNKADKAR